MTINLRLASENINIAAGFDFLDMHAQLVARLDRLAELYAVNRHKQNAGLVFGIVFLAQETIAPAV